MQADYANVIKACASHRVRACEACQRPAIMPLQGALSPNKAQRNVLALLESGGNDGVVRIARAKNNLKPGADSVMVERIYIFHHK